MDMITTMLSPDEFVRCLEDELLSRSTDNMDVTVRRILKTNGVVLHACTVRPAEEGQAAPTVYLEPYYARYRAGETIGSSAGDILERCCDRSEEFRVPAGFMRDYAAVRGRLVPRLIGTAANREFLTDVPHVRFLDMSVVFCYIMEDPKLADGAITIHMSEMRDWDVTPEMLLADALKAAPALLPLRLCRAEELLGRTIVDAAREASPDGPVADMMILTNRTGMFGASAILYDGAPEMAAEKMGGAYFILPSSVCELILLPDREGIDPAELSEIVREVNRTELAPQDVLTDSVYRYRPEKKRIERVRTLHS